MTGGDVTSGVINELPTPLFGLWQSSPQAAFDTVKVALPDMTANSVIFPGSPFG